jgi:hypothetical protein
MTNVELSRDSRNDIREGEAHRIGGLKLVAKNEGCRVPPAGVEEQIVQSKREQLGNAPGKHRLPSHAVAVPELLFK